MNKETLLTVQDAHVHRAVSVWRQRAKKAVDFLGRPTFLQYICTFRSEIPLHIPLSMVFKLMEVIPVLQYHSTYKDIFCRYDKLYENTMDREKAK